MSDSALPPWRHMVEEIMEGMQDDITGVVRNAMQHVSATCMEIVVLRVQAIEELMLCEFARPLESQERFHSADSGNKLHFPIMTPLRESEEAKSPLLGSPVSQAIDTIDGGTWAEECDWLHLNDFHQNLKIKSLGILGQSSEERTISWQGKPEDADPRLESDCCRLVGPVEVSCLAREQTTHLEQTPENKRSTTEDVECEIHVEQQSNCDEKLALAKASSEDQIWQVVGGVKTGGILVRAGGDYHSPFFRERLATGALLQQVEIDDNRLKYICITGKGPLTGWVSLRTKRGSDIVVKTRLTNMNLEVPILKAWHQYRATNYETESNPTFLLKGEQRTHQLGVWWYDNIEMNVSGRFQKLANGGGGKWSAGGIQQQLCLKWDDGSIDELYKENGKISFVAKNKNFILRTGLVPPGWFMMHFGKQMLI